jgi:hypothetical protein
LFAFHCLHANFPDNSFILGESDMTKEIGGGSSNIGAGSGDITPNSTKGGAPAISYPVHKGPGL